MDRSRAALELTIETFQQSRGIRMWTFTFAECTGVKEGSRAWTNCKKQLIRKLGFRGVRVYELHPGGHGLHIHVLTDQYYRVEPVRAIANRYGFGRIHVCRVPWGERHYVAKYVGKQDRARCLKGVRLWQVFGGFKGARCKSVTSNHPLSRWYRKLRDALGDIIASGNLVDAGKEAAYRYAVHRWLCQEAFRAWMDELEHGRNATEWVYGV